MGARECDRKNCSNIMCDTYIVSVGYICSQCSSEFKEYLINESIIADTENKLRHELSIFIKTSKGSYIDETKISAEDFFKNNKIHQNE